jgi:RNA polymerase sigma-70 factor, ECF subfamily
MTSTADDSILTQLDESRRQFLALVNDVRPDLHRYCARMTGSIPDGEDVVQDTLARAYYELPELKELPAMRSWLFRIAHNRALDYLRRYERRMGEPLEAAAEIAADNTAEPDIALTRQEAVRGAISQFLELAPAQRSCVILKDVLDYSLEEITAMLEMSLSAVKAALHRGRTRLRELSKVPSPAEPRRATSPALARYAALFNARDWDGVRAILVDEVKLDLVSRWKATGRRQVSTYFTNYDSVTDWHLVPGWLDSREILAVLREPRAPRPTYFIELRLVDDGRVAAIRDFRYVPYIAYEAEIEFVS